MRAFWALIAGALLAACVEIEPIEPATTGSSTGAASGDETNDGTATGADDTGTGGASMGMGMGTGTGTAGSDGPCMAGQEGCPCTPGGGCDEGLDCLSGLCVDVGGGCPVGGEGCPCTPGGACDPGLRCVDEVCEPGA